MRRGRNVVSTYGRHRQRRIASDPWSCVEAPSRDVFSTSSDASVSVEEPSRPSVVTRSSRSARPWNKENDSSGLQHTSENSSDSGGIFGSGKTFSRRILQLSNTGNNTSDEFQQTKRRPPKSTRKNPRRITQKRNTNRAKENAIQNTEPDLSAYDFSDIEKYSLIISESPLAGGGEKVTCDQLGTPAKSVDCLSSTPNVGQQPSLEKYSLRNKNSGNEESPQREDEQNSLSVSPGNLTDQPPLSACQRDLDRLHLSSIAGSPASDLEQSEYYEDCSNLSTHSKSYSGKLTSSKLDSFAQEAKSIQSHEESSVDIIEPSPQVDCPAANLRSAKKKSKKWYHQVFPTYSKKAFTGIQQLNHSSELDSIIEPSPVEGPAANLRSTKKSKSKKWYHQVVPSASRESIRKLQQELNSSSELESVGAFNITYRLEKKKKKPLGSGSLLVMLEDLDMEEHDSGTSSGNSSMEGQSSQRLSGGGRLRRPGKDLLEDSQQSVDEIACSDDDGDSSSQGSDEEEGQGELSEIQEIEESIEQGEEFDEGEDEDEEEEYSSEEEEVQIQPNGPHGGRVSDVTRYMLTSILEDEEDEDEEDEESPDEEAESKHPSDELISSESHPQSVHEGDNGNSFFEDTQNSPATASYYTADGTAMTTPRHSLSVCKQTPLRGHSTPFKEALTPGRCRKSGRVLTARDKVLQQCDQTQPVSFSECIPPSMMAKCVKIGEGVYGEVFRSERRNQSVALKVIPIEGNLVVNDEQQKKFEEMLPEIVISRELSALSEGEQNCTPNFVQVKGISLVQGSYPPQLLACWDAFHQSRTSQNDRPDIFPDDQYFVIFEFADSGYDLESVQFADSARSKAVLQQVALSLAVAEQELQFEHRDLHWGNVLVKTTKEKHINYVLNGQHVSLPSEGVKVAVIDFTLSRLSKDGCAVFCDLSVDETLFTGEGDYQFEVYRLMKEENGNEWSSFHPFTNVLWLHYLCDKLRNKTYKSTSKEHKSCMRELRTLGRELLQNHSAFNVIHQCQFFEPETS